MRVIDRFKAILSPIGYLIFHSLMPLFLFSTAIFLGGFFDFDMASYLESNQIFFDVIYCGIMLYIYSIILYQKDKKHKNFLYTRKFHLEDFLFYFPMMAIGAGTAILWSHFIDKFGDQLPYISQSLENLNDAFEGVNTNAESYIWIFLSVVIIGPIMEEVLFRGIIFGNMKKVLPIPLAIFLNGVFFGVFHMNLVQGVYTFVAGAVLASIYYYSESLSLVIILHIINNLISTFPPFVYDLVPAIDFFIEIGLLVLMPLGIYNLVKLIKNNSQN